MPASRTVATLLGVTLAGCRTAAPPPPPAVTVARPVAQRVSEYLDFTGNTAATNSVTVVARVEGYLEKIHFADGARVAQGDLLFAGLYVANRTGQMVPLGALIGVRRTLGAELLTRFDLYPAASLVGNAAPGFSSGQALAAMERVAAAHLPAGMGWDWTGIAYQEQLVGNQAYFIFALSITLVFLVLAGLYESWTHPAAVILTVPMALVGIVVALVVRGFPVDLYTQIGLVLMIALAAKNAILVVEFARERRAEGMPAPEAAILAARRRFRPIVMTSIAFVLGVVPLLTASGAGAASQQALGTVVFGGMLASTLLAIPFVPGFYVLMDRAGAWREARRTGPALPPAGVARPDGG